MVNPIKGPRGRGALVAAAAESGLPFEPSPTGRFIRVAGERGVVYVVQDAWGEGCTVMEMGDASRRRMEHYLSCTPALRAAAEEVGIDLTLAPQPAPRAKVG
ncbi:MAG: hypothetical protein ACYC4L_09120 [Chloroflexota bacterium]